MTGAGERAANGTSAGGESTPLRARRAERGVVLEARGDFDLANAKHIRNTLAEVLREDPELLVVDMAGVTFISSVGLSLLVEANALAGPNVFRVVAGGSPVLRVIALSGLDAILSMYDTVDSALATP
ncbi:STAS domain-containing protein [Actinophytocola gossypii]|uniref:Anti-sigma factor antagonist n=1 Tax=Actinophytocola gossypii TaxID=2812003 RepID=A0ABT2J9R9_9PSEU|nr:STAS domain-containing protein [Actinophytocola gossypii]MCT2584609.1 STAS domain-containing protein [Actinophytocola gossypii]